MKWLIFLKHKIHLNRIAFTKSNSNYFGFKSNVYLFFKQFISFWIYFNFIWICIWKINSTNKQTIGTQKFKIHPKKTRIGKQTNTFDVLQNQVTLNKLRIKKCKMKLSECNSVQPVVISEDPN